MKIAYFWTWDFSASILKSLINDFKQEIEVSLIISQPDKRIWRKRILQKTAVKVLAEKYNIKVLQPESLILKKGFKTSLKWEIIEVLEKLNLDFIVVVAYGKIIPENILNIPKYWCINIHWSILPTYRWASPIQEAIKNWDKQTGLTIMYMNKKMDEWDILKIAKINIDKEDKAIDVFNKFEKIWSKLLVNTLIKIIKSEIKWQKQDSSKITYCSKITKQDWKIYFSKETWEEIYNKFRAYNTWPWIYTYYKWKKLNIEDCEILEISISEEWILTLGKIIKLDKKTVWIICKNKKILILKEVKLEWKKTMDILSFINGNKDFLNYKFN